MKGHTVKGGHKRSVKDGASMTQKGVNIEENLALN